MQLPTFELKEPPSSLTYRTNSSFIAGHRADLGVVERIKIGFIAAFGNKYGRITRLSNRHHVSRKTIYAYGHLAKAGLYSVFSPFSHSVVDKLALREAAIRQILYLRLIGRCCLLAISTILNRTAYSRDSVGFISQTLHAIGDNLSQVIDYQGDVNWACDEIYHLGNVPILITVDPLSGAILQMNIATEGLKEAWLQHWQRLNAADIHCLTHVMDEGWQLRAARLDYFDPSKNHAVTGDFQPDSFHAVSHRLGIFDSRLQKAAFKAIEAEYERERLCFNTQTPNKLPKFKEQWAMRQTETQKAIQQYDQFSFLYRHLLKQLTPFDRNGQASNRASAQSEARCAIELMMHLEIPGLNKELAMLLKIIPELFKFLDKTADCCHKIIADGLIQAEYLPFWAKAWSYEKKAYKVKNNYQYQQNLRKKAQSWLNWLQKESEMTQQAFKSLQNILFTRFDGIIQSSAAVEMVNSILRPYLNQSRDQVTQQTLNLIMDYYNNRPFTRGKRKGKSPIEILTGKKQDKDWFDKIIEIVRLKKI